MQGKQVRRRKSPWLWIPSLYFASGMPYVVVMTVSVIMYKRLGLSNTDIALYTSWLYLPWVIKPFWSPLVDILKTKRSWIVAMQLLIGAGLGGVALTLPTDDFFRNSMALLWLLAFSSATHDIAADGFYMLGLSKHEQTWFVGIRSTFYRLAMIAGQGLLIILAGSLESVFQSADSAAGSAGDPGVVLAWTVTFYIMAGMFVVFFAWHRFVLPQPEKDVPTIHETYTDIVRDFLQTFAAFFNKPKIGLILAFLLLFRFSEAQLVKIAAPFMLDSADIGGLALSTGQVGFAYGTIGILMLTLGGLLGGFLAARHGLKHWLLWMVISINLPNAVYVFLSFALPDNLLIINLAIGLEQFGYGFGFAAYMLYMLYISNGAHQTAHYAICTGFMALGMMIPGMFSGWLQELMGYQFFFIWVLVATVPSFIVTLLIPLDKSFGRKEPEL
ncbi:MAG: MFS transporter [Xanthomonadales bacterium]|nr:MFS transporter [Xanthomonadales bacterium]MDH4018603.1 MFS transporter [Xanthomonadales bacterium]